MIRTFILVALRSFKKNKLSTSINALGLILGFSTFIVLSLFVYNEISYDRWHEKSSRIYRFTTIDEALGVTSNQVAITNPRMPEAAEVEIPEIEIASRMLYAGEQRMERDDQGYYSEHAIYVENDFFEIFDLPVRNREEALEKFNQPHKLILTDAFAEKVFGTDQQSVGQILTINDQSWEVVGLMDNITQNSHLGFDALMSLYPAQSDSSLAQYINSWGGLGMLGYAVLAEGADELEVETKMADIALANDVNDFWIPQLQPLEEIHLGSAGILFDYYHQNKGDKVYVYSLSGVAIFILLIAAFNFVNLTTAQSTTRAKEVGIRKVVGSSKALLISQHMIESILMATIAMLLSLAVVFIITTYTDLSLNFDFLALVSGSPIIIAFYITLAIIVGILAGVYPSFILSSIKSVNILRGRFQTSSKGIWLRKTLVVLQFVAAIGMICTTLIVSKQIDYIKNKHLGFDKEQVININIGDPGLSNGIESYKQRLDGNANIVGTAYSNNMPGSTFGRAGVNVEGGNQDEPWIVSVMSMDENYLESMGMELAAGRNYDPSFGADQQESIIINEAMMESLGWDEAVGKNLVFGNNNPTTRKVIGVIKDFHFSSMRHKIEPLMIFYNPGPNNTLVVKVSPGDMRGTLDFLETEWNAVFPNYPFDFQFFDQEFDQIFASDELFARLVNAFTGLSIIISALGLFGLSFFMVEQRKKEIGVRKVLGSTIRQIVQLLMREFVFLIILANIIAWPIAFYFLKNWISDFQYRIDLLGIDNLLIYVLAGVGALIVAMVAVSYKSINAALSNPVNSLRDE
ncbi:ABC transporter permease [Ekhidna sp.]|uniref:ABC transporter permease n=1 Tax=Ekhidna sp. TaxID=2608089 RepID=UPI0035132008